MHIFHDRVHVSLYLGIRHHEQRVCAPREGRTRSKGDQSVHIRGAVKQTLKAADEEFLVDHHDDHGEKKLCKPHRHMVSIEKFRKRPVPHHMPHGEIHEDQEKTDGGDKSFFQDRSLMVFQGRFIVERAVSVSI